MRIKISVALELEPLIPGFLANRHAEIKLLTDAIKNSDYVLIKTLCHTIKGVGGGYGFEGIAKIAANIELAAKQETPQRLQDGLQELVEHLQQIDIVYENIAEEPLVMCVDDEPSMLRLLERTLSRDGFRVMSSLGGNEAITLIQQHNPNLILMDIRMPELNGHEICARLKKDKNVAGIPIIFVTGEYREEDNPAAIFSTGNIGMLTKPFDLNVLVQKARETIRR